MQVSVISMDWTNCIEMIHLINNFFVYNAISIVHLILSLQTCSDIICIGQKDKGCHSLLLVTSNRMVNSTSIWGKVTM